MCQRHHRCLAVDVGLPTSVFHVSATLRLNGGIRSEVLRFALFLGPTGSWLLGSDLMGSRVLMSRRFPIKFQNVHIHDTDLTLA